MFRFLACFAFLCGVLFAVHAGASEACYDEAQLHAEQLLRLHSELMVITVSCRVGSNGQPLGSAYGDFTKRNITVLHDAEETMKGYYRQHARGDVLDHLDRLRTILANEFSQKSADMGAKQFCAAYRDRVLQFDAASSSDVENEAERMTIAERSYVRPCDGGKTQMVKAK